MALSASPRKVVPLASGDDWQTPTMTAPAVTKRVFFCGIVMRNIPAHANYPEELQELVGSFGEPLRGEEALSHSNNSEANNQAFDVKSRAETDYDGLNAVITELVATERSYVQKLRSLKLDYADPLRNFSKSKNTAILPAYTAKALFSNIDQLLPVNEAFLVDLERMMSPEGASLVGGVGNVALRHFRDSRGFENYKQFYANREEAQKLFKQESAKKGFAEYIDRIKYGDGRSRVGLDELLMEPVQRLPRYTLLFRTMMKYMSVNDPQRSLLQEAMDSVSKIASAEMDDRTKQAAVLHSLFATVDNFPPALIKESRRFIDCIDVEDNFTTENSLFSSTPGSSNALHCTLMLFDDKLMILKRPQDKSGRTLAGLDQVEKATRSGGLLSTVKKNGLSCKGVVELTEVVATDVGRSDFHLYVEKPPMDEGDRWSGRYFRPFTVVYPPSPAGLVPTETERAKNRFLQNLFRAQALYRAKDQQSFPLVSEEQEVETKKGRITFARTYYNVYQRTEFLKEKNKPKIVVHIDDTGSDDPIPLTGTGPPYGIIRVQPMAGGLSRYIVMSSEPNDEEEQDIVQTARVADRVAHTIHQFGLFKFKTGKDSAPATPNASHRSRAGIFGLDVISRNLFNAKAGTNKTDIFGGGSMASRRTRSSGVSRTNTTASTATTSRDGSVAKFSQRSRSTAATSVYDDGGSTRSKPRSISRTRKFFQRGKSPATGAESDYDRSPSRLSQSHSRESSMEPDTDVEDEEVTLSRSLPAQDSEFKLTERLRLARQNSEAMSLHSRSVSEPPEPEDAPIYDDDPPESLRPHSRASRETRDTASYRSVTPTPGQSRDESPIHPALSTSTSNRPVGPRAPSPLPPTTPTRNHMELPSVADIIHTPLNGDKLFGIAPLSINTSSEIRSPIPRSRRMPFEHIANAEATPRAHSANSSVDSSKGLGIHPLLIKKKSTRDSSSSPTKETTLDSPLFRTTGLVDVASPTASSSRDSGPKASAKGQGPSRPQLRPVRSEPLRSGDDVNVTDTSERVSRLTEATKVDLDSARAVVKRIKLEVLTVRKLNNKAESPGPESPTTSDRPSTPTWGSRIPTRVPPPSVTKEAQARMAEMHALIARRSGVPAAATIPSPIHGRARSMSEIPQSPPENSMSRSIQSLEEMVGEVDVALARAMHNSDKCMNDVKQLLETSQSNAAELETLRAENRHQRMQLEVMKELNDREMMNHKAVLDTAEEELNKIFDDVQLPEDEAWQRLTEDVRQSKADKWKLSTENAVLKRKLADLGHDWQD